MGGITSFFSLDDPDEAKADEWNEVRIRNKKVQFKVNPDDHVINAKVPTGKPSGNEDSEAEDEEDDILKAFPEL
eukprot:9125017-Karenia_brevis.AAC.1